MMGDGPVCGSCMIPLGDLLECPCETKGHPMTTTDTDAPELLPCPFCGGQASGNGRIKYTRGHKAWWPDGSRIIESYYVNCMDCGCSNLGMFGHQTKADAVVAWNRRADLAKPRVKPLVWEDRIAASEVVTYRIHIGYGLMTGHFALSVNGKQIGTYPTEEAAKAAANAHHAANVLAQLEGE